MPKNIYNITLSALKSIQTDRAMLDEYHDKILGLKSILEGTGSPTLSDMPRGHESTDRNAILAQYIDLRALYKLRTKALQNKLSDFFSIIKRLNPKHATLLYYRYIKGLTWSTIALKLGLSESHTYKLHRDAVQSYGTYMHK